MSTSSDEPRPRASGEPTRTFGPPVPVVVGTLIAGFVFGVILEFMVLISMIGQRLWNDPRLGGDLVFTLPLLLWVLVAAVTVVVVLRVLTGWLTVTERGIQLRALTRRTVNAPWERVSRVIAVRDIERSTSAVDMLDPPRTAYDGLYVLGPHGRRLVSVSSRFFGDSAQEMTLARARGAGVRVDAFDRLSTAELAREAPFALTFLERHPNLFLLLLAGFYVFHNVLTFAVWGL